MSLRKTSPRLSGLLLCASVCGIVFAREQNLFMHRNVTFTQGAEDVAGLWLFEEAGKERLTRLLLRQASGQAIELEQRMELLPVFAITTELRQPGDSSLIRVIERYPTILVSRFEEVLGEMESGEPFELLLQVGDREPSRRRDALPADQSRGFGQLLLDMKDRSELLALIPAELHPLIRILTEVAGPDSRFTNADDGAYAIGTTLLGGLSETGGLESENVSWRVVEGAARWGHEISPEGDAFIKSVGTTAWRLHRR